MFMFGYDYVNMNTFLTSQVTNVIFEPFVSHKRAWSLSMATAVNFGGGVNFWRDYLSTDKPPAHPPQRKSGNCTPSVLNLKP